MKRALIIDDDPSACQFLADALTVEGFNMLWTADPEDGVLLAEQPETAAASPTSTCPSCTGWICVDV
jgi:DNA-binding response OmpR family regulator